MTCKKDIATSDAAVIRRETALRLMGDLLRGPFAYLQDAPEACVEKAVALADALLARLARSEER